MPQTILGVVDDAKHVDAQQARVWAGRSTSRLLHVFPCRKALLLIIQSNGVERWPHTRPGRLCPIRTTAPAAYVCPRRLYPPPTSTTRPD